MPELIVIRVNKYSVKEACEKLAELTGHRQRYGKPYSRERFYAILRAHGIGPDLITEDGLVFLSKKVGKPGRPSKKSKNIDKRE